ncbi:hypothetical protein MMC26_004504 [Xylographa opegraphella]|nr:hypothetical protein [Xylographa opegraphella]
MVQGFVEQDGKHAGSRPQNPWELPETASKVTWDNSFTGPSRQTVQSRSPVSIAKALRELCGNYISRFAIIYADNSGKLDCEVSRSLEHRLGDIFPRDFCETFAKVLEEEHDSQRADIPATGHQTVQRNVTAIKERRRHSDALSIRHGQLGRAARQRRSSRLDLSPIKRRTTIPRILPFKPSSSCTTSADEDDEASETDAFEGAGVALVSIRISDTEALEKFYRTRFIQMQQIPCKVINKAWIKVVQPKKQARHPYNGGKKAAAAGDPGNGDLTRPDWWPREGCRHKEPDHIQKEERLILLLHILRNLRDYKGGDGNSITVEQLQQSTKECFVNMPRFKSAGDYLNEIYHIRQQEERFFRGEIDDITTVAVFMPDKEPKEAAKKAKVKAVSAVKAKRHGYAVREPPISMIRAFASHAMSPVALPSPIERPAAPQPKLEALHNFNRLGLYADRAPDNTQDVSRFSSSLHNYSAAPTAQISFPLTEVESMPQRSFGAQEQLQSSYPMTYGPEAVQNTSFTPMSLPEDACAVSVLELLKQLPVQHGIANQTPMQDIAYTTPTFAQSERDPAGWYSSSALARQQHDRMHASAPYTPSVRSTQNLGLSVSNQMAPHITGMPYNPESGYAPTQTQYNSYNGGTSATTYHGLPGYDDTDMNVATYYNLR